LQRSFELIGEPENRKIYDENLEKALHTEKAFTELNDLLIQLQTKISEAANTIRCSSCCFRHPRKFTGRKAFAARECKTCKIRHPGREGDIWAETTFFGLRWKYLALMEGNVYDITGELFHFAI
jgi:DnaJ homolog subfamily C member 14